MSIENFSRRKVSLGGESIISSTEVTTRHHVVSKSTLTREGQVTTEVSREVKLPLSRADHAFVHYATWKKTGDKRELDAYNGQRCQIEDPKEQKVLQKMIRNRELVELWGNPREVEKRVKNVHFF